MKIDFIDKVININRMPWENNFPNNTPKTDKNDEGSISLNTLKFDGPAPSPAFRTAHLTGIEVDITMRHAAWGEPSTEKISWEQNYTNRITDKCEDVMYANYWGTEDRERLSLEINSTGLVQVHLFEGDYTKHAAEVRETFLSTYESILSEIKYGFAHGLLDEEEYNNRLDGLNKAYDKTHLFAYYGLSETQGFGVYEMALRDIKSRYANGDFGEGEGVYEARLEAWSAYFDTSAAWAFRILGGGLQSMTSGHYEANLQATSHGETMLGYERSQLFAEVEKLYHNARDYLLAGNSAATLKDNILNEGLSFLTAENLRFFHSKEFAEMKKMVRDRFHNISKASKTQSEDKKKWENLFAYLKEQISNNETMSDVLKRAFLERFAFGVKFFPNHFKSNFIEE